MVQIRRKNAQNVWEHIDQNGRKIILSKAYISTVDNSIDISEINGSDKVRATLSEIEVYDDASGGGVETFPNTLALITRLKQLGYPYFDEVVSVPSTGTSNILTSEEGTLNVIVASFNMIINEQLVTVPGQTLTLQPNTTRFIGVDLVDYTAHYLVRDYQDGMIWLGQVTTDNSSVDTIINVDPELPVESLPKFKNRLLNNTVGGLKVAVIMNSLGGVVGGGVSWQDMLFNSSQSSIGLNVPNVMRVDNDDFFSGGQTSLYGNLWVADPVYSAGSVFNNTGITYTKQSQFDYFDIDDVKDLGRSPILFNNYDLVIVSFGANGGTQNRAHVENLIRKIRESNIEVLLYTQNHRSEGGELTNQALKNIGDFYNYLKQNYNCAIADSWAFVKEIRENGTTTLVDTVHPNQDGRQGYALSARTVINDKVLRSYQSNSTNYQSIRKGDEDIRMAVNFPNHYSVDFFPNSTTGTLISSPLSDDANPALLIGGKPANQSIIELNVGEVATFNNVKKRFGVLYSKDNTAQFEVYSHNQNNLLATSPSYTFTGNTVGLFEVTNPIPGTTNQGALSIQIRCTSGTAKIYGILYYDYENTNIRLDDVMYTGTWATESSIYTVPRSYYTDTLNDSFSFNFYGSTAMMLLNRTTGGGIVDIYLDGRLVEDNLDLYSGGTFLLPVFIEENVDFDSYSKWHNVTVKLVGENSNAIAPTTPGRRRLQINNITIYSKNKRTKDELLLNGI